MSTDEPEVGSDAPLIDADEGAIAQFIAHARRRGFVTMDEVEAALPQDQMSNDQIEQVMAALSDMGIRIVENDEGGEEEDEEGQAADRDDPKGELDADGEATLERRVPSSRAAENLGRTDDPVRMYLREMGAVEMLSREGEAAVAKRIEAGRDMMIWGLCESPLTFHAIIQWSEALDSGDMQLREILDLDAMHSTEPAPEAMLAEVDGEISEATAGPSYKEDDRETEPQSSEGGDENEAERTADKAAEDDEDSTLNLAELEAALKNDALAKFAQITEVFRAFDKLQRQRLEAMELGTELPASREQQYQQLREELTALVESVKFHASKIEYLIDSLYELNRRLMTLGGKMLRLAERHKIMRTFLD